MKTIIESKIHVDNIDFETMVHEINTLIDYCNSSKTLLELRTLTSNYVKQVGLYCFDLGFGCNHFWVANKSNKERVLFVEG